MKTFYLRNAAGFPVALVATERVIDPTTNSTIGVTYALAVHNPKDKFNKKRAHTIAEGRVDANRGRFIPMQEKIKLAIITHISIQHPLSKVRAAAKLLLSKQVDSHENNA